MLLPPSLLPPVSVFCIAFGKRSPNSSGLATGDPQVWHRTHRWSGSADSHCLLVSESPLQHPPRLSFFVNISTFQRYFQAVLFLKQMSTLPPWCQHPPLALALSPETILNRPSSFSTGNAFRYMETAHDRLLITPHPQTINFRPFLWSQSIPLIYS